MDSARSGWQHKHYNCLDERCAWQGQGIDAKRWLIKSVLDIRCPTCDTRLDMLLVTPAIYNNK